MVLLAGGPGAKQWILVVVSSDESIDDFVLMLSLDMVAEKLLRQVLAAVSALVNFLRARFLMQVHVSLFNELAAFEWAGHFELVDDLLEAHVNVEVVRHVELALRTLLWVWRQPLEASLADDHSTLRTVVWLRG